MRERDYTPAIYGSLLVTTLIAVQSRLNATPEFIALSLVLSVAVFWLTHAWSAFVNERVHGPVGWAEVVRFGVAESPMLAATVIPAGLLALARMDFYSVDVAVNVALAVSLVQLFLWGLAVGRRAHTSWLLAVAVALVDFALGLVIVVLKLTALH